MQTIINTLKAGRTIEFVNPQSNTTISISYRVYKGGNHWATGYKIEMDGLLKYSYKTYKSFLNKVKQLIQAENCTFDITNYLLYEYDLQVHEYSTEIDRETGYLSLHINNIEQFEADWSGDKQLRHDIEAELNTILTNFKPLDVAIVDNL